MPSPHGRGTGAAPANRFTAQGSAPWWDDGELPSDATEVRPDTSRSVLVRNESPDVPFAWGLNPYRGCEHGCSYCYARPYHEYLGHSAGLDFERILYAKHDAPELLASELADPRWQPETVTMSGVTDCYQPLERRLRLTRGCLEVFARCRHPVALITKNALIARDADLLAGLATHGAALATISVTTLDADLARVLEPRASAPPARLATIRALADAGVPVGVNVAPVIPGLTDRELPAIVAAAAAHGARHAAYQIVRLPLAVAGIFADWLAQHRGDARDAVLRRIQDCQGGTFNDARFGARKAGSGIWADQIAQLFRLAVRRHGLDTGWPALRTDAFLPPHGRQLRIW